MDFHRILLIIRGIQWIINGLSMDYQWIPLIIKGIRLIINGLSQDSLDYQRNPMDYQWIIVDSSG